MAHFFSRFIVAISVGKNMLIIHENKKKLLLADQNEMLISAEFLEIFVDYLATQIG